MKLRPHPHKTPLILYHRCPINTFYNRFLKCPQNEIQSHILHIPKNITSKDNLDLSQNLKTDLKDDAHVENSTNILPLFIKSCKEEIVAFPQNAKNNLEKFWPVLIPTLISFATSIMLINHLIPNIKIRLFKAQFLEWLDISIRALMTGTVTHLFSQWYSQTALPAYMRAEKAFRKTFTRSVLLCFAIGTAVSGFGTYNAINLFRLLADGPSNSPLIAGTAIFLGIQFVWMPLYSWIYGKLRDWIVEKRVTPNTDSEERKRQLINARVSMLKIWAFSAPLVAAACYSMVLLPHYLSYPLIMAASFLNVVLLTITTEQRWSVLPSPLQSLADSIIKQWPSTQQKSEFEEHRD
ncbi:MAG: hypothetical protein QXN01_04070 [Candidatus Anstonellales archaeon]